MPADDVRMSNEELMLMISSLELVSTIVPAADVEDSKLVSERVAAVNRLILRLNGIASKRGLRPTSKTPTKIKRPR